MIPASSQTLWSYTGLECNLAECTPFWGLGGGATIWPDVRECGEPLAGGGAGLPGIFLVESTPHPQVFLDLQPMPSVIRLRELCFQRAIPKSGSVRFVLSTWRLPKLFFHFYLKFFFLYFKFRLLNVDQGASLPSTVSSRSSVGHPGSVHINSLLISSSTNPYAQKNRR